MRKSPLLALALGAGLLATLAGCSTSATSTEPTSTSSANTAPSVAPTTPENVGKCVDGNAVVVTGKDKAAAKLTEACDNVSVIGANGTVELAAVKHLVVEGAKNTISLQSVEVVDFAGSDNTVSYSGGAPKVNSNGTTGNTAKAAG